MAFTVIDLNLKEPVLVAATRQSSRWNGRPS